MEANRLAEIKQLLMVQGDSGNWNYDSYMHGMYNGMELIVSMIEGREPQFREAPPEWLCDKPFNGEPIGAQRIKEGDGEQHA